MIAWKMIALASARPWQADHEESCRCFPWRPHARAIPNGLGDICHGSGTPRANLFQGQLYCCLAKAWAVPGHRWNHLKHLWTTWQPVHKANVIWIWQTSGDNFFFVHFGVKTRSKAFWSLIMGDCSVQGQKAASVYAVWNLKCNFFNVEKVLDFSSVMTKWNPNKSSHVFTVYNKSLEIIHCNESFRFSPNLQNTYSKRITVIKHDQTISTGVIKTAGIQKSIIVLLI